MSIINEPTITIHGHTTEAPELRYTPNGTAVAEFGAAQNPRYRDGSGQWRDGEATFLRVRAWRELAESIAESLDKGHRVTIVGRVRTQRWQDKETSENRSRIGVEADDVAVSLRGQRTRITKARRDTPNTDTEPDATAEG